MPRQLNLVFQGGGVKGIAYAGVLATMPDDYRIHAVAGTSAGAIAAGLVAIGVRGAQLKAILSDRELFELLDRAEAERFDRLQQAFDALMPRLRTLAAGKRLALVGLARLLWDNRQLLDDINDVWTKKGFHSTTKLRKWLEKTFGDRDFSNLTVHDLRIVAADVDGQSYKVYNSQRNAGTSIAEAVLASVSIPLFFHPFATGGRHLVDGGILSNYPSFLFAQAEYPTIGFRFQDVSAPTGTEATSDYLRALLLTMAQAHDKLRLTPRRFQSYEIPIPEGITATKFSLTENDVDVLYKAGVSIGERVDWLAGSSDRVSVSFFDLDPDAVLEDSLRSAHEVGRRYRTQKALWADKVVQDAIFTVTIDRDWSTRYERENALTLEGPHPLFVSTLQFVVTRPSGFAESLTAIAPDYVEVMSDGRLEPLLRVPSLNEEKVKGFLVFYTPPVAQGTPRRFRAMFRFPREFAETLGQGRIDEAGCSTFQLAAEHQLDLVFRVRVNNDLPMLEFEPEFEATEVARPHHVDDTGTVYRCHEWHVARRLVSGELPNTVRIRVRGAAKPGLAANG